MKLETLWLIWCIAMIFVAVLMIARPAKSEEVDAVIVTAIDASSSTGPVLASAVIQHVGHAVASDQVMNAINAGKLGRVAMLVFVWAETKSIVIADWTIIDSKADAINFDTVLTNAAYALFADNSASEIGYSTDLSGAMVFGNNALDTAPFETKRRILNIIGDGVDNVAESPIVIRDTIRQDKSKTLNYVMTDYPTDDMYGAPVKWDYDKFKAYLETYVTTPNGFILFCNKPKEYPQIFRKKFVLEISLAN